MKKRKEFRTEKEGYYQLASGSDFKLSSLRFSDRQSL